MFVNLDDREISSCVSGVGALSAMSGDGCSVHVVTGTGLALRRLTQQATGTI